MVVHVRRHVHGRNLVELVFQAGRVFCGERCPPTGSRLNNEQQQNIPKMVLATAISSGLSHPTHHAGDRFCHLAYNVPARVAQRPARSPNHEISASLHEHTAWYPLGYVFSGVQIAQVTQPDRDDQVLSGGHNVERGEIIKTPYNVYRWPPV